MTESITSNQPLESGLAPSDTSDNPRGTAWEPSEEQAYQSAHAAFLEQWPEYQETEQLDRLRLEDFARLDRKGHVYLDYTGGGLYGESLVRQHAELLCDHVFGNPHSTNPTSSFAGERVEACRRRVLEYFNGSPDEYVVIFTSNASHSLKLVGESYPFESGDQFLLTFDNHNSVNGIREFANQPT